MGDEILCLVGSGVRRFADVTGLAVRSVKLALAFVRRLQASQRAHDRDGMLDPGRPTRGADRPRTNLLAFGCLSNAFNRGEGEGTTWDRHRITGKGVVADDRKGGMVTGR